ncbi:hypothetical protein FSP39_011969 [Pinctada imbricata]|uniref:ATP-dependent DNA helicase n=1 Tax=Pinctada imbricata TaxID=66713 RepID=A0AA88YE44_PINIB|nr:hypothetical protein FSP39_011969 [Pinctada imbricata]
MAIPRLDTSFIESIICYSCQQMAHPDECTNVKTCDQNQVCVVESTKDDNGNVTYNSGCINKQSCGYLVPPRSNRRRQGQVTEQCKLCCGEDFCNYDLCDHGSEYNKIKYVTCSNGNDNLSGLIELQTHKHSKTCRKKGKAVCRFGFPLPPLSKTMLLEPLETDVEKYKKKYDEIQEKINKYKDGMNFSYDQFLHEVVNMPEDEYIKCIRSSINGPKVFLKRMPSDVRVNMYNKNVLQAWNANIDLQFVLDPYACAMYIVSYISKSQRGMSALMDRACKEARQGNMDIKKQVRHIGNHFLNSVEVSAQEASYLVLQMPLTKGSRDVIFINTSPPHERVLLLKQQSDLMELSPESTDIHYQNIIARYSKRPRQLDNWCLADYASQLDIKYPEEKKKTDIQDEVNDDDLNTDDDENLEFTEDDVLVTLKNGISIKRRIHDLILRYVRYNVKTDPENHYRERLLLFMPWRDESVDLLNGHNSYQEHYRQVHLLVDNKANFYEKNIDDIERAMQEAEEEFAQHDEIAPNAQQTNADDEAEGQQEASDFVMFNPDRPLEHRRYDIGADIGASTSVPNIECHSDRVSDDEYLKLVRSLNIKQREFFTHVLHWINTKDQPLYAFLSGGAGVGKSVLIKAIYQALHRQLHSIEGEDPDDIRILLCAFTGKAAYNINGVTIASAFHKKYNQSNQSMSSDELNTFRMKYRNLSVVIIDEISMVGGKMLSFIDCRLKQLTATNKPFGGISIIAVGDLFQLQPVGDSWIFSDLSDGSQALATNLWKEHFGIFELTQIMRQKDDMNFANLLNRLRTNNLTEDDKAEIEKHNVSPAQENYPKNVPHLFVENKFVDNFNKDFIDTLSTVKVEVLSHDAVVADLPKSTKDRLLKSLPMDSSKTANLAHSLVLAVGMIYDITVNLDVNDGIANGSTCIVKYIENRIPQTSRPSVVWVLFSDVTIGSNTRQKYKHLYNVHIDPLWTPIFDVNRNFLYNYKSYQRTQFPLKPAAAKTVHKAQGCTVDEIVIDLSQSRTRKTPHIHYVAMSRVRTFEKLHILNFNHAALGTDDRVKDEMNRLREEANLELCYKTLYDVDSCYFKLAFNNARSFHKHFADISVDPNILAADVIGIMESRLCTSDVDETYTLDGFQIHRCDQHSQSGKRPSHGLVLYLKEYLEWIQKAISEHRIYFRSFDSDSTDTQYRLTDSEDNDIQGPRTKLPDNSSEDEEFDLMVDAIHPVHPNCQDGSHRDCQDLLTKFGASCQNPGIAQLCPQSCGKCVDDSSCTDNATFNCAEVGRSFSICDDVDAARKYCRRYCGDCNFVNGGWSSWSHWSDCDSPCGYGSQIRLRKCSNPPPTKLGHRCTGSFQESRFCLSSFYCASRYRYVFPLIQNFAKDRHHRNIELLICADDVVTINVSIPLNPGAEREMVLHAGLNVVNFSLGLIPEDFKKEHKAVEIKSRDPVAAYVLNYEEYSSDVFYIYEARDLSTEYILTMLQSYSVHNRSMATIAALNDNTLVNVTFQLNGGSEVISVNKRTYSSGDSLIIKLDRLQEYEITYNGDLTGTHITSNQNLAVTSGNECLQIGAGSCSHSSEMTIPLSKYGTKYIVPMVFNRTIVTAQIISGFDSNNVTIRGRKSVTNLTLGKGQFKNLEFSEPVFIRSEKGISVSIFVHGRSDHQGDPFMMSVPSIDHYQPDYHFPVPSGYSSYATVIMEDKYDGNLLLDKHGIPPFLTAFEVLHDLKRYLVFTINVSTGAHRLEHSHGAVFGLFIHGDRYGDGYGYMAGHNKLN